MHVLEQCMECVECGAPMLPPTIEKVPYDCGLPNVMLENVRVHRCAGCDAYEVEIPNVEHLHERLTQLVARKEGRLLPLEIKFLRKSKGWSGQDAAAEMHVTHSTWSRWENGRMVMSRSMELLLRTLALCREPVKFYEDLIPDAEVTAQPAMFTARLSRQHEWEMAAAAK